MDPDESLKQLRELVTMEPPTRGEVERICMLFQGLDQWLTRKGFKPKDWEDIDPSNVGKLTPALVLDGYRYRRHMFLLRQQYEHDCRERGIEPEPNERTEAWYRGEEA